MFGVGAIIDNFTNSQNTFAILFLILGGTPAIGFYFYKEWKRFVNKEIPKDEILINQEKILRILSEIKNKLDNLG